MTHKEKKEWLSKLDDVISALDEARSEVEDFSDLVDDRIEENTDLNEWKNIVLEHLPEKCSLKFRLDVEEMLEKFKGVY
jgi:hypothetical protein